MRSAAVLLILSFALLWPREWPGDEKVVRRPLNAARATSLDELFSPRVQDVLQSPDSVVSYLPGGLTHGSPELAREVPRYDVRQEGRRLSWGERRRLSKLLLNPENYYAASVRKLSIFMPHVGYTLYAGGDSVVVLVSLGETSVLLTSGDLIGKSELLDYAILR